MYLGAVGVTILGVLYQPGGVRPWWVGFGLFEGGYLLLAFGPWFAEQIQPRLVTTQMLNHVYIKVNQAPPPLTFADETSRYGEMFRRRSTAAERVQNLQRLARNSNDPALVTAKRKLNDIDTDLLVSQGYLSNPSFRPSISNRWQALLPGALNYEPFLTVGHCLFAVLAGFVGGEVATRFYSKQEDSFAQESLPQEG